MQKSSTANCIGNVIATKCCIISTCMRPSFMCENQKCQCKKNHENCDFPIPKSYIMDRINKVKSRYFQTLIEIQKWYQQKIKTFEIEKDNLIRITDQQSLLSKGNVGIFNALLKQDRSNQITSKLVFDCFNSLSNEYNISSQKQLGEVKLHLEKKNQQVEKILEYVRQRWVCRARPHQQIMKFSTELKHPDLQIIDGNKARVQKSSHILMGFLQPCIQNTYLNKRKFQFKINKLSSTLLFGVSQMKSLHEIKNQFAYGVYQITTNQIVNPKREQIKSNFSFSSGDIIEIQYDPSDKKVTFTNKNLNIQDFIYAKYTEQKPLYLFIKLSSENDEVQYLGETTI